MKWSCEFEREQRTCLDCNVRRIGRCQQDIDRWRIGEIVGIGGLTGVGKTLTDVWNGTIGNRLWNVLFDSLF